MSGSALWYLNRSTGVVLLVLLSLTLALGILAAGARAGGRLPAFVPQSLHRSLSGTAVLLLGAHLASAVADEYVDIRWWQVLSPIGAGYQPLWLGLGALSVDLLLAVLLTSLLRHRLSPRWWRLTHLAAYAAWPLAMAHSLGIGTDISAGRPWALGAAAGSGCVVAAALGVRLYRMNGLVRTW